MEEAMVHVTNWLNISKDVEENKLKVEIQYNPNLQLQKCSLYHGNTDLCIFFSLKIKDNLEEAYKYMLKSKFEDLE